MIKKKKINQIKEKLPAGAMPETHTLHKQVVAENLNVSFSFYVSSNSFASFLS